MEFQQKVYETVTDACVDLKSDTELHQLAQLKLKNQLWESFENFLKEGLSEEESSEKVFFTLGSVPQIKEKINREYLPKLNCRQKQRKIQNRILIPIAFIFAIICTYELISFQYPLRKLSCFLLFVSHGYFDHPFKIVSN